MPKKKTKNKCTALIVAEVIISLILTIILILGGFATKERSEEDAEIYTGVCIDHYKTISFSRIKIHKDYTLCMEDGTFFYPSETQYKLLKAAGLDDAVKNEEKLTIKYSTHEIFKNSKILLSVKTEKRVLLSVQDSNQDAKKQRLWLIGTYIIINAILICLFFIETNDERKAKRKRMLKKKKKAERALKTSIESKE